MSSDITIKQQLSVKRQKNLKTRIYTEKTYWQQCWPSVKPKCWWCFSPINSSTEKIESTKYYYCILLSKITSQDWIGTHLFNQRCQCDFDIYKRLQRCSHMYFWKIQTCCFIMLPITYWLKLCTDIDIVIHLFILLSRSKATFPKHWVILLIGCTHSFLCICCNKHHWTRPQSDNDYNSVRQFRFQQQKTFNGV